MRFNTFVRLLISVVAIAFLLLPYPAFAQQYATVKTTTLNVRTGPGTQYPVGGTLLASDRVEVVASQPVDDYRWYSIVGTNGKDRVYGWVRGDYLDLEETRGALGAATDQTVLAFQTEHYAVRVYRRGGQLRMNVFDQSNQVTFVNGAPASVAPARNNNDDWTSYVHRGEVEAYARVSPSGEQQFELVQVSGNRIVEAAVD